MKKFKTIMLITFLALFISQIIVACDEEEDIVIDPLQGINHSFDQTTGNIAYFDFETDTLTEKSESGWQIAFECITEMAYADVVLNAAAGVMAYNTEQTDWAIYTTEAEVSDLEFAPDKADGTDNVIVNYYGSGMPPTPTYYVYIIQVGCGSMDEICDYYKLVITDVSYSSQEASFLAGPLTSATEPSETIIPLNMDYDYTYVDLETKTDVSSDAALIKSDWDFVITKLINEYEVDGEVSYSSARGAFIINVLNGVTAYHEGNISFNDLTIDSVDSSLLSDQRDVIGNYWWAMDGMPPTYSIIANSVYVLEYNDSKYSKLECLDYTNDEGSGGYIEFQYSLLN